MNVNLFIPFAIIYCLFSCKQADKKVNEVTTSIKNFIQPPVNGINVPYLERTVNAAIGDTIFYKTGSIIVFPPNSFVDKDGKVIQGNVQVKYREFSSPMDFYLAGIPMDYDSAGKPYTLESSGMCEIIAHKEDQPVFVNPESKPEINLATNNLSKAHNIYYLDTVQKQWQYGAKSLVSAYKEPIIKSNPALIPEGDEPVAPLKPERANDKSPVIKLLIDPSSFEEFTMYNNLQFQLDVNEKNFNHEDTSILWSNMQLMKGESEGLYTIKLSSSNKTVSYKARPVFEGEDYEEALKVFNEKQEQYLKQKKASEDWKLKAKKKYMVDTIAYAKLEVQSKENEKMNLLIEARNREIKKQNEVLSAINESGNNFRIFVIDRFGYWNCDEAVLQNLIEITATFVDEKGELTLENIAVFCKGFNSVFRYQDNIIRVVKNQDNMIVGTVNGAIAYISYEEYRKLGIDVNTKRQVFPMTILSGKENNYEHLTTLSGRPE